MAEQAAGTVASAVIGGVTDRALSTVIRKLRSQSRPAAAHEKLQQLEMLVLKLQCAVEVSEKHAIGSASLLEWRDRLREAAAEGGAVVLDFQRRARAREEDGEAASASTSTAGPGQQPAAAGALFFTRSALSGMARRVRDVTRRLLSTDEDMKKLDGALEKMERLSPDITQFLMALQLEVSQELAQRAVKRRKTPPAPRILAARMQLIRESKRAYLPNGPDALASHLILMEVCPPQKLTPRSWCWADSSDSVARKAVTSSETSSELSSADQVEEEEDQESEAMVLARDLALPLQNMDSFIKATDGIDLGGFEWMAEWAALLREAVERGNAVIQTLHPGSDAIHDGGALEEDGELYSFVRAVQELEEHGRFWWTYALRLVNMHYELIKL